jgi:hypothetical protein
MDYKKSIGLADKLTKKKCEGGLMHDVMKACLHWFIKVIYEEGYEIVELPDADTRQMDLFPADTCMGDASAKKVQ